MLALDFRCAVFAFGSPKAYLEFERRFEKINRPSL
jgi:hypothetical protein